MGESQMGSLVREFRAESHAGFGKAGVPLASPAAPEYAGVNFHFPGPGRLEASGIMPEHSTTCSTTWTASPAERH